METYEELLAAHRDALERCVRFRVNDPHAAEDILQETRLSAWQNFGALRDPAAFKPWLLRIAQNKCRDYFRALSRRMELPLDVLEERAGDMGLYGRGETSAVHDTLALLADGDRQLLYLHYFRDLPLADIARMLGVPEGTVKSRLHYAKRRFRDAYSGPEQKKGEMNMKWKHLPDMMPDYRIEKLDAPVFPVRWEEVMGWFIVPREGEKLSWAMYDFPERRRTMRVEMEAAGRMQIHGVEGVEIRAREYDPVESERLGAQDPVARTLVAQLTQTHCRLLAESHVQDGVRKLYTFLDGDSFLDNWGFGEDNCGNEVALAPRGDVTREGDVVTTKDKTFLLDVVGRYAVTIGGRRYDTVCVMDCYTYDEGVVSEQFLDANGRTILWRRFNRDDWHAERYGALWSERLPDNERLTVNGRTYVHWYDCITDYIL